MQVQVDPLEQVPEVENAVTAPFENFDFVVETGAKGATAILSQDEVIGNLFPPGTE